MDWTWLPEQRRMVHLGQQLGDVDPQERQRPTGDAAAIQALGSPVFQPQILPAATVNMPPWPGQAVFATPYGVDASYGSMVWGGASLQATPWRSQPAAPRFGAGMSLSRGRGRIRTSSRSLISSARGQRAGRICHLQLSCFGTVIALLGHPKSIFKYDPQYSCSCSG